MKSILNKAKRTVQIAREWTKKRWEEFIPSPGIRKWANFGIFITILSLVVAMGWFIQPGLPGIFNIITGVFLLTLFVLIIWIIAALGFKLLFLTSKVLGFTGLIAFLTLIVIFSFFPLPSKITMALVIGSIEALFFASIGHLLTGRFKKYSTPKKALIISTFIFGFFANYRMGSWILSKGNDSHLITSKIKILEYLKNVKPMKISDPSLPGPYKVLTLTYGSGKDKRRAEFGEQVSLKTSTVDATPFVKENKGFRMKLRKWYWGFDFKHFPINGRVWYPQGKGPFPLVLIVHGNHKMGEYSDPGYEYLGKHLASRGFIFASVDENFFNGSWLSYLKSENDGRGWLLLQHLKQWKKWHTTEGNIFYKKVDMNRIALIGHSRGGEAAAIAGAFNRISHYPDDATIKFDFGFNIKSIIAIAPSDGQYNPSGKPTPLKNVNYFVLQGAHDADVSSYVGIRQFQRVKFTDGNYWIKAALYTYRSNHGQFNTIWQTNDWGKPMSILLNKKPLLKGKSQRKIAKVYITAFLEATLKEKKEYLPILKDWRYAWRWLPHDDFYINRFQDSTFLPICTYEEDIDVETTTIKGGKIKAKGLAVWRETQLKLRKRGTKKNTVVYLGWRNEKADTTMEKPLYSIELPADFNENYKLNENSLFVFSIADSGETPPKKDKNKEEARKVPKKEEKGKDFEKYKPKDVSIELIDTRGHVAKFPLSDFGKIPPVLKSHFTKIKKEKKIFGKSYEPALQYFQIPLSEIKRRFPEFEIKFLKKIKFIFDRDSEGMLILDDLGFAFIK